MLNFSKIFNKFYANFKEIKNNLLCIKTEIDCNFLITKNTIPKI